MRRVLGFNDDEVEERKCTETWNEVMKQIEIGFERQNINFRTEAQQD